MIEKPRRRPVIYYSSRFSDILNPDVMREGEEDGEEIMFSEGVLVLVNKNGKIDCFSTLNDPDDKYCQEYTIKMLEEALKNEQQSRPSDKLHPEQESSTGR